MLKVSPFPPARRRWLNLAKAAQVQRTGSRRETPTGTAFTAHGGRLFHLRKVKVSAPSTAHGGRFIPWRKLTPSAAQNRTPRRAGKRARGRRSWGHGGRLFHLTKPDISEHFDGPGRVTGSARPCRCVRDRCGRTQAGKTPGIRPPSFLFAGHLEGQQVSDRHRFAGQAVHDARHGCQGAQVNTGRVPTGQPVHRAGV